MSLLLFSTLGLNLEGLSYSTLYVTGQESDTSPLLSPSSGAAVGNGKWTEVFVRGY